MTEAVTIETSTKPVPPERLIVFVFLALLGVLAIAGIVVTLFEVTYTGARPIPTHHIGSL